MNITKEQLKRIIKDELQLSLKESSSRWTPGLSVEGDMAPLGYDHGLAGEEPQLPHNSDYMFGFKHGTDQREEGASAPAAQNNAGIIDAYVSLIRSLGARSVIIDLVNNLGADSAAHEDIIQSLKQKV